MIQYEGKQVGIVNIQGVSEISFEAADTLSSAMSQVMEFASPTNSARVRAFALRGTRGGESAHPYQKKAHLYQMLEVR